MYIPLEIIIGTVPLTSAVQQYQQTLSAAQPSAPPEAAMRMGLLFLSITIVNFRYPPPPPSLFSCDPVIIRFAYNISKLGVFLFQYIKQIPKIYGFPGFV